MSRRERNEASRILEATAGDVGGAAGERHAEQADQLARLAEQPRGPDHGRLDRHQRVLRHVGADVDDVAAERIDEAIDLIARYRETVPGV